MRYETVHQIRPSAAPVLSHISMDSSRPAAPTHEADKPLPLLAPDSSDLGSAPPPHRPESPRQPGSRGRVFVRHLTELRLQIFMTFRGQSGHVSPSSLSLSSPRWSLSGPEISGPENDQIVWSLSGPGRCLVLLHRTKHCRFRPKELNQTHGVDTT